MKYLLVSLIRQVKDDGTVDVVEAHQHRATFREMINAFQHQVSWSIWANHAFQRQPHMLISDEDVTMQMQDQCRPASVSWVTHVLISCSKRQLIPNAFLMSSTDTGLCQFCTSLFSVIQHNFRIFIIWMMNNYVFEYVIQGLFHLLKLPHKNILTAQFPLTCVCL